MFTRSLREIGDAAAAIWGVSMLLKDVVIELFVDIPGPGWIAQVLVASVFVFFLGV